LIANGGKLALLPTETIEALNAVLPQHWSHGNPVDILGDADPERLHKVLEIITANPESDGLLVILAPQGMSDFKLAAEQLVPFAHATGKPVFASWMGGPTVASAQAVLNQAEIVNFSFPDEAAKAFATLWRYSFDLRNLYETPTLLNLELPDARESAEAIVTKARAAGRSFLTEYESKAMLGLYGIPTVRTEMAIDEEAAVTIAERLGYPVVLKLHSETITHKTEVGGVKLGLEDAAAVQRAYNEIKSSPLIAGTAHFQGVTVQPMAELRGFELLLGSSTDPQFGPVIVFGSGGTAVEVYKDRAIALPPLNSTLAQRLIERTKISSVLYKPRSGKPVDLDKLGGLLVRFAQLVLEQRWIKEIDINPLLANGENLLALDARMVLHGREVKEAGLPQPAIRPYPAQYAGNWQARDGEAILFRPIRPEDEPLIREFHSTLSVETVQRRYLHALSLAARITHERLLRTCFVDYDREFVLVAVRSADSADQQIVGVGRLTRDRNKEDLGEVALVVADQSQGQGIGTELMRRLVEISEKEGMHSISAAMLTSNTPMLDLARRFGFQFLTKDDGIVTATRKL
jgi:acetyltransferase